MLVCVGKNVFWGGEELRSFFFFLVKRVCIICIYICGCVLVVLGMRVLGFFVCVCVCVILCVFVYILVCMFVCVFLYMCVYVFLYVCVFFCIFVFMFLDMVVFMGGVFVFVRGS